LVLSLSIVNHEYYMQMALDLAKQGWPQVAPNPMVGAVVVHNNQVAASGFHMGYGLPHAEVNAINALPADISPSNCILYVSLEPCNHQGKTGPCTELIIKKGFKEVVVACLDPNPLVSGQGVEKLRQAGISVTVGVLEEQALQLNRRFMVFHELKRPYLVVKWAQTADGFISRVPLPKKKEDNIITRKDAQVFVHKIRAEVMGVLVGKNTVLNDDPHLTTRLVKGKNPIRIFIDKNLEIPSHYNVFNTEAPTIVFNLQKEEEKGNVRYLKLEPAKDLLPQVFTRLHTLNIQSLLVEGGATLINELIKNEIWDEVLVFQNPDMYFKEGLKAPVFALKNTFELVGNDKLFRHLKNERSLSPHAMEVKEIF